MEHKGTQKSDTECRNNINPNKQYTQMEQLQQIADEVGFDIPYETNSNSNSPNKIKLENDTLFSLDQEFKSSEQEIITLKTTLSSKKSKSKPKSPSSNVFNKKTRSELPSFAKQNQLQWNNINVFGNKDKQILHNMNGSISSGELMAIMGGSGAGKSTLLNILSGRTNLNEQRVDGYFTLKNKIFKCSQQKIIKSICSFVPQSDIICPTQTVYEALLFYAKLKLPNKPLEKQIKRISYLINVLHLESCKNNIIGDATESKKGISGGERRRVSIAAEIINDVDIIFLDEPTSGLDAYTASATIKTLKEFCTVSNKIIICTIHQPSIETFYLFDKLILLSHGKCCFNSTVNNIDIFFKNALKPKTNPADVIIFEIQQNTEKYALKWKKSNLNLNGKKNNKNYDENTCFVFKQSHIKNSKNNLSNASFMTQLKLLLQRELQSLYRDKRVTLNRLAQVIFFALACGVIFYQVKESFSERAKCHFLLTIIPVLFGMVSLLVVFPKQKELFKREYSSNTYSTFMFALSFMLIEIPREIIHMLMFVSISYYLIGFDGNIFYYWLTLFLCSFSGGSFGMIYGTISKSATEAAQMVPASLIPLLMFSDGIVPIDSLPNIIKWIAYVDPLYYLLRCFFIIEFNGVTYDRTLSEDDQYVCDKYGANGTYYESLYNNNTIFNCSMIQYNITIDDLANINISIPDFSLASSTTTTTTTLSTIEAIDFSTTLDEAIQNVEEYCSEEIPSTYFFDLKDLNPNDLYKYWCIIIILCIVLRILSIVLLYIVNNNGISWLWSLKNKLCCFNNNRKEFNKKVSTSIDISIEHASQIIYGHPTTDIDIDIDVDDNQIQANIFSVNENTNTVFHYHQSPTSFELKTINENPELDMLSPIVNRNKSIAI